MIVWLLTQHTCHENFLPRISRWEREKAPSRGDLFSPKEVLHNSGKLSKHLTDWDWSLGNDLKAWVPHLHLNCWMCTYILGAPSLSCHFRAPRQTQGSLWIFCPSFHCKWLQWINLHFLLSTTILALLIGVSNWTWLGEQAGTHAKFGSNHPSFVFSSGPQQIGWRSLMGKSDFLHHFLFQMLTSSGIPRNDVLHASSLGIP